MATARASYGHYDWRKLDPGLDAPKAAAVRLPEPLLLAVILPRPAKHGILPHGRKHRLTALGSPPAFGAPDPSF